MTIKTHIINITIDNEFGALARVIELFSARGYNIETLSVAPLYNNQQNNISVITITTQCSDKAIALICKLLNRIVPVHTAKELHHSISQELVLLKVAESVHSLEKLLQFSPCRWRIINPQPSGDNILELIGNSTDLDTVLASISNDRIINIARSGIVAIEN